MNGRTNSSGTTINDLEIPLDPCTNLVAVAGNGQVSLTWTDPKDKYATPEGEAMEDTDQLVSEWSHTIVVRKVGSQPQGPNDGTIITSSSVRNQYQMNSYNDTLVEDGTRYYYGIFACNKDGIYSDGVFADGMPLTYFPVLNDNSWESIANAAAENIAPSLWEIGDTKSIHISGRIGEAPLDIYDEELLVFIIGFNHNSAIEGNGITFQGFKNTNNKFVGLVSKDYGAFTDYGDPYKWKYDTFRYKHDANNYNGWEQSDMRLYTLGNGVSSPTSPNPNTLLNAFPSDLRSVLKEIPKYSNNSPSGGVDDVASLTTDYITLASMYEIFGTISSGSDWEMAKATPCLVNYQQQYEYYQLGNSRVIYPFNDQSTSTSWVTRDIRYDDEYDCIHVWYDGNARRSYNYLVKAIAPIFKV